MEAVTYIDPNRNFKTYRFNLLKRHGITGDLMKCLKYAHGMIECKFLRKSSNSHPIGKNTKGSEDQPLALTTKSANVAADKQATSKADVMKHK